jgi:hypothetical protein
MNSSNSQIFITIANNIYDYFINKPLQNLDDLKKEEVQIELIAEM